MDNRKIYKNIFGRELADAGSKELLERVVADHPYFTPAQFYLLQQTNAGTKEHEELAARTAVLFNNPWWLNFQLQQTTSPATTSLPEMNEPKKEPEPLLFEPMHMVDYFASQGIKLSEEEATKDKLGKQLKSFTEWLKTMKKLPSAGPEKQAPVVVVSDSSIQHMAEKSNEEGEVVTESMAEVLIMQGKTAKAIGIYEKLSLTNPSKSAYFAAKIQNLKES